MGHLQTNGMIHSLQGALLAVLCKVSREREGKKERGETGWFWHKLKLFLNIQNFQKIFVEDNEECFEIIFWNILFVLKWNSKIN